jgi:hypothetical protein
LNIEEKEFQKIVDFYDKNKRIPQREDENGVTDWNEYPLYKLLQELRNNPEKADVLKHLDKHGLLDKTKFKDADKYSVKINYHRNS